MVFNEHVMTLMWVRGPSMTPYLNEDYGEMQTKSDVMLVNLYEPARDLRRGMVVAFR
jgi:mitochondrial inner membrane protease subunit 2